MKDLDVFEIILQKLIDENKVKEGRIDFYNWFTELDRRRNTNFVETFPDMIPFWELCKGLAEEKKANRIGVTQII
jgi:hypothetical protein